MKKPPRYKLQSIINEFRGRYKFLSNFSLDPVLTYKSNEHFFQAMKTTDYNIREQIKNAPSPFKAKIIGRNIKLRPEWGEKEFRICKMYLGLKIKFSNPELKQRLLETGNAILEEGNDWHDNFWGNCYCQRCIKIKGENYLGKLLMKLREELKNGS